MIRTVAVSLALFAPLNLFAAMLPGFQMQMLGSAAGFVSSMAIDSRGTIYYTTTKGNIFRFENGQSTRVGSVTTDGVGNAGLLGMALAGDVTAIVHYTTPSQAQHVISAIDLRDGSERVITRLFSDPEVPGRGTPSEHHGGNPIVAPDGTIFVGIGDFGGFVIAQRPEWIAGKILRITPQGVVRQYALGFRNPFDLAWDVRNQQLIVPDNGEEFDDEINIVQEGGNYGWPWGMGHRPGLAGTIGPVHVFSGRIAPTGFTALGGKNSYLRSGYLLGSFTAKTLFYVREVSLTMPDPLPLIERDAGFIIDVVESPAGEVYFTNGLAIYRLDFPAAGDCNGDSRVDLADFPALERELAEQSSKPVTATQDGEHRGSWGCDANLDGVVDSADRAALFRLVPFRVRAVRGG